MVRPYVGSSSERGSNINEVRAKQNPKVVKLREPVFNVANKQLT